MRILILGCGPAGLMAAHAAVMHGDEVIIISKARKSRMEGAQYLHEPIPVATLGAPFRVSYELRGTPDAYRRKIYGESYRGTVSPEDLRDSHFAYDIRETYDFLWDAYGSVVMNDDLTETDQIATVLEWAKPDLAISTIPATLLCSQEKAHVFSQQQIWSTGEFPLDIPDNTVICNAEINPAWYRAANIQGHITMEWPSDQKPPITGLHSVVKPLNTNCNCFPQIVRMGRYGNWMKGILSHTAFYETRRLITQPLQMEIPL